MNKKYTIEVNGEKISVSKEIYREWKHYKNKEEYADRRSMLYHVSWEDSKDQKNDITKELALRYRSAEEEIIEQEEIKEREQHINLLKAKIKELKPRDAYIVEKVFLEEKKIAEVAADLGLSQQAMSYRLKSILKHLKKMLSNK